MVLHKSETEREWDCVQERERERDVGKIEQEWSRKKIVECDFDPTKKKFAADDQNL